VQKVVQLLGELEMKIIKDGESEKKAFTNFQEWCRTGASDKEYEIKTAKSDIEDLTATIGKADSDLATSASKIEDLGGSISSDDADLTAATGIRHKENKEFLETEKEMVDTIDTLERAVNILQRKMHGSAMLQAPVDTKNVQNLVHTLTTVIDAASLSLHDRNKLIGLVQSGQNEEDDDFDLGAPAPDAYKSHSSSIIDVLTDLRQKAETQLDEARKEEMNAKHNFQLLKQSLNDQITVNTKELNDAKIVKHEASESKATAAGDLVVTKKDLKEAENVLHNMAGDCRTKASDNEMSVKNREEELKAIAVAKKALLDKTGGAAQIAYGSSSFIQVDGANVQTSVLKTHLDLINFEVVNLVRTLAREQKSAQLTQLATRIAAVVREESVTGQDPFKKVKELISNMIDRLQKEAGDEATHKAYCDKELAETKTKVADLKYDIEKHSSKIDKAKADSATLKDEVSTLQHELANIARSQTEGDSVRKEENSAYSKAKVDLEQGLDGVRMALKILRDYYSSDGSSLVQQPAAPGTHQASAGAGGSIIGMLEVVESDLGRSLANENMNEEAAAIAYQRLSMGNKVMKTTKEQDVKYKTKEAAGRDKMVTELTSDRDSASTELDAVLQYTKNIRGMCVLKPETYSQRKGRREQEMEGLKEALRILEGEAAFLQRQQHGLRGAAVRSHH